MRFQGKVALITAAASGIGRATANIIGREGGRIAAVDINRERLDATVAEIAAAGGEAHAYNADALDEGKVESVVADAAKRFGQDRHPGECRGRQHDHRQARAPPRRS